MTRRLYWIAVAAATASAFAFRIWFGAKGYFWGDDLLLRNATRIAQGPGSLFEAHAGQVTVIGAAARWMMLQIAPNSYLVTVVWTATLLAGAQVAIAALFARLQGPRWIGVFASA